MKQYQKSYEPIFQETVEEMKKVVDRKSEDIKLTKRKLKEANMIYSGSFSKLVDTMGFKNRYPEFDIDGSQSLGVDINTFQRLKNIIYSEFTSIEFDGITQGVIDYKLKITFSKQVSTSLDIESVKDKNIFLKFKDIDKVDIRERSVWFYGKHNTIVLDK